MNVAVALSYYTPTIEIEKVCDFLEEFKYVNLFFVISEKQLRTYDSFKESINLLQDKYDVSDNKILYIPNNIIKHDFENIDVILSRNFGGNGLIFYSVDDSYTEVFQQKYDFFMIKKFLKKNKLNDNYMYNTEGIGIPISKLLYDYSEYITDLYNP